MTNVFRFSSIADTTKLKMNANLGLQTTRNEVLENVDLSQLQVSGSR